MSQNGHQRDPWFAERTLMVRRQLRDRGIADERILAAMAEVPRHCFVPPELAAEAYADRPLPIGCGATISQPFMVAFMTQALAPRATDRVLEIGSGSGYQTAILAKLVARVYAVEIIPDLVGPARARLAALGLAAPVEIRAGDGRQGWPEAVPFDGILVAACVSELPPALLAQLAEGGRVVYPQAVRPGAADDQDLWLGHKQSGRFATTWLGACRFVPLL